MRLSIQARLMSLSLLSVLIVVMASGWLAFREAGHEVDELIDGQLVQYARIMLALAHSGDEDRNVELPLFMGSRSAKRMLFQIWEYDREGDKLLLHSPGMAESWPAGVARTGYSNLRLGDSTWRCLAAADEENKHYVLAALDMHVRDELSRDIALVNLKPYLYSIPVLALLLAWGIHRSLAPLRKLDADLAVRSPERLDPLADAELPHELNPLVATMNRLFSRVARTLDNERRFTSDAAHELRTPLAALRVQLQVAQRVQDEGEKQAAVAKAVRGAERMTHLVGQLLALARIDGAGESAKHLEFDLSALLEDAVREMTPIIAEKGRHLEHQIEPDLVVVGNPDLLGVLIRNLLDNGLRYSADDGRISVRLTREAGKALLRVADDGPGVAPADREKLGTRFQRFAPQSIEGVGLGLSIVRRIAELHGARLDFGPGLDGKGLGVTLQFSVR
ncbi:MAG: hypothetical protein COS39_02080 [Hydrogenophilales bacterium CG03_land_8_20_14_0_80_62_28]|nr:MAG: hypothetical protein AUJ86_01900 [Hydrogenophilaceae bacterium CG1_02_62_390]PIV24112.1 MAG: hypothetical protein COS39_02080 [Hydrogenophilales bacterium CG03_land_8_20_14_0_80_62_28]PIW37470.1 MAG: hypothetical protein COW23_11540 [Hydrogenophilales bacterium CG15_BIG_FIL_POST_REV_8_21_14_020_62_31]